MKRLRQPNAWSCLPTCLAMLANKSVDDIIKIIGHDGSEIVDDTLDDPECRRSFTDVEIIYAADQLNIHLVPFVNSIYIEKCLGSNIKEKITFPTFKRMLERYSGILLGSRLPAGERHSTLWDRRLIIDPRGEEYLLSDNRLNVETFWAAVNLV